MQKIIGLKVQGRTADNRLYMGKIIARDDCHTTIEWERYTRQKYDNKDIDRLIESLEVA
jgi:hypothetical protein